MKEPFAISKKRKSWSDCFYSDIDSHIKFLNWSNTLPEGKVTLNVHHSEHNVVLCVNESIAI